MLIPCTMTSKTKRNWTRCSCTRRVTSHRPLIMVERLNDATAFHPTTCWGPQLCYWHGQQATQLTEWALSRISPRVRVRDSVNSVRISLQGLFLDMATECTWLSDWAHQKVFQQTVPTKTAKNTVKHWGGSVDLVVTNHHGDSGNSVTITTLVIIIKFSKQYKQYKHYKFIQITVYNYESKEFAYRRTII